MNPDTPKVVPVVKRRSKNPPELAEASKQMTNAFSTLNQVLNNTNTAKDDDCELYGRLLATKLRKFSEVVREDIMLEIDTLLINRRRVKYQLVKFLSFNIIFITQPTPFSTGTLFRSCA